MEKTDKPVQANPPLRSDSMTEDIPTFSVHEHMVTYENPKSITDGIVLYKEATIEIDTRTMSQTFVHLLMHHIGEGHIRVKVARMKEQA